MSSDKTVIVSSVCKGFLYIECTCAGSKGHVPCIDQPSLLFSQMGKVTPETSASIKLA